MDIELKMTCSACPEQYDAYDEKGNVVGYLRLRHGFFRVECPGVGGEAVFIGEPLGDGVFYEEEREFYLGQAKAAIKNWTEKNNA